MEITYINKKGFTLLVICIMNSSYLLHSCSCSRALIAYTSERLRGVGDGSWYFGCVSAGCVCALSLLLVCCMSECVCAGCVFAGCALSLLLVCLCMSEIQIQVYYIHGERDEEIQIQVYYIHSERDD